MSRPTLRVADNISSEGGLSVYCPSLDDCYQYSITTWHDPMIPSGAWLWVWLQLPVRAMTCLLPIMGVLRWWEQAEARHSRQPSDKEKATKTTDKKISERVVRLQLLRNTAPSVMHKCLLGWLWFTPSQPDQFQWSDINQTLITRKCLVFFLI